MPNPTVQTVCPYDQYFLLHKRLKLKTRCRDAKNEKRDFDPLTGGNLKYYRGFSFEVFSSASSGANRLAPGLILSELWPFEEITFLTGFRPLFTGL